MTGAPSTHMVAGTGGSLHVRVEGEGPVLVLLSGGPGNADALAGLTAALAGSYTVVTHDRRGYSRSPLDDPAAPVDLEDHAADVVAVLDGLGVEQALLFGSSIGGAIGVATVVRAPERIIAAVIHEPPLRQLLAGDELTAFAEQGGGQSDPSAVLRSMGSATGVRRGVPTGEGGATPPGDVELFVRRDVPAVGRYRADLDRLRTAPTRIIVAGGEENRDFYPYRCASRLAAELGAPFVEVPGDHAGMMHDPEAFAVALRGALGEP